MPKQKQRKSKPELTRLQRRFIEEYLLDLNATQAVARAGYRVKPGSKSARVIACKLMAKPVIIDEIEKAMRRRQKRVEVKQDQVIAELARIAFADLRDFVEFGPRGVVIKDAKQVDGRVLAEVTEVASQSGPTRRVKLHDKLKALELLGRHLGMFTDKHEIAGSGGGPLIVKFVSESSGDGGGN